MTLSFVPKKKNLVAIIVACSVLAIGLFLWWGLGSALPKFSELKVVRHEQFATGASKEQLTIATYNIAHSQGIKLDPTDWRDESYTRKKLLELGSVVKAMNADILLLQEVDLNSDRSHNIDQAEFLIRAGKYAFSACAVVWEKNYIPFPFWPLDKHLGQVQTANCVLSKYPLSWHNRIIFDKPASNPFWYNWGYLDRGAHRLEVQVGDKALNVINLHLEAFEQEARQKQAHFLSQWIAKMTGPIIVGGDFNSIPRSAAKKDKFIDEPGVSFAADQTIESVKTGLKDYTEALCETQCMSNERLCHTFPSDHATRRLDHIFASNGARFVSGRVFEDAGEASDHLPVIGIIELN